MKKSESLEIAHKLCQTIKDIRYEIMSRSGLIHYDESVLDVVFEVTCDKLIEDLHNIIKGNYSDLDETLKEYKDKFVNLSMILHHELVTKYYHFNWN